MRVKTGTTRRKRHKKILKQAKGYRMTKHKHFKSAKEATLHAGEYAFFGRKLKKREMRKTWIRRINAALSQFDISYSKFISALKKKNVELNRKILADLAVSNPKIFEEIVKKVKPSS